MEPSNPNQPACSTVPIHFVGLSISGKSIQKETKKHTHTHTLKKYISGFRDVFFHQNTFFSSHRCFFCLTMQLRGWDPHLCHGKNISSPWDPPLCRGPQWRTLATCRGMASARLAKVRQAWAWGGVSAGIFSYMGVSKNTGTPKWMVYNGKPYQNG